MYPLRATFLAALLALAALPIAAAPAPVARAVAALVYDGQQPDQIVLQAEAFKALLASQDRVELRRVDASDAPNYHFLRRYGVSTAQVPCLLILDGPGTQAKLVRRLPLSAEKAPIESIREICVALKLPPPRLEAPPAPGVVAAVTANGSDAEKKVLAGSVGVQGIAGGVRHLAPGSIVVYRLRLPASLRRADLRVEASGSFRVEVADNAAGPWTMVIDSHRELGTVSDLIRERIRPVVSLDSTVELLPGPLYLRVLTNGHGRNMADLVRVEVVALGRGEPSKEAEWLVQAEKLRNEQLAALPEGARSGRPLAGALDRDTVLTFAESPYLLTGELTVPLGRTLTVEPGVSVFVMGGPGIVVQGRLEAKGTADKPIVFAPGIRQEAGQWRGIQLLAAPGVSKGAASVLQYCRIANADAVVLDRFAGEIAHCLFEDAATGLTLRNGGTGRIHHNQFLRCRTGVSVEGGAGELTENLFDGCDIALAVVELAPKLPWKFEQNSLVNSRYAAVSYLKHPLHPRPALRLPNNHWGDTPAERLRGGGASAAEVRFDPKLPAPPEGVGTG